MSDPDGDLLDDLRAGDDAAFAVLVGRYHAQLLHVAESLVSSREIAEEVVQDTWLGVVRGIEHFEGRSSIKTWIFHILVNRARSAGSHEPRCTHLGAGVELDDAFGGDEPWMFPPEAWDDDIDERVAAGRLACRVRDCLTQLPAGQRRVFMLHDIEGMDTVDVCERLGVSAGNQRVLLHRARARMRLILEKEMGSPPLPHG